MRVSDKKLNSTLRNRIVKTFVQALTDIKGFDQSQMFINDFFTEAEVESFAKRLAVAYWLKKGRSYINIKTNLNASTATIASVEKIMKKPGYQLILSKVEAEEWANIWSDKIKKITGLGKKYQ